MDHNGLPAHRTTHRPGRSQAPVHGAVRTPGTPGRSRTPGTPATSRTPSSGGRTPATPGTPSASSNRRNGRVSSLGNSAEKEKHVIQSAVSSPPPNNNRVKHSVAPPKPSFSHDIFTSNKTVAQNASKSTASKWTAIYDYEAQGEVKALHHNRMFI